MKKQLCTRCCKPIEKSGINYPHLCRECEKIVKNEPGERFACTGDKVVKRKVT